MEEIDNNYRDGKYLDPGHRGLCCVFDHIYCYETIAKTILYPEVIFRIFARSVSQRCFWITSSSVSRLMAFVVKKAPNYPTASSAGSAPSGRYPMSTL